MAIFRDLTGNEFGDLKVTALAEPRFSKGGHKVTMWKCVCSCGKETVISSGGLISDSKTNCGCNKGSKLIDLTGMKFGEWTVIKRDEKEKGRIPKWECECSCGVLKSVAGFTLRNGESKSCGCSFSKAARRRTTDITGLRSGKLVALELEGYGNRGAVWKCSCDCGNTLSVDAEGLRSGHRKSCGCFKKEAIKRASSDTVECKSCGRILPICEFHKLKLYNGKASPSGRCKKCEHDRRAVYKFGLKPGEYEEKLSSQKHRCAICNRHEDELNSKLAIDHDHTTGNVRGLLCSNCNVGLGHLRDSVETVSAALAYLQTYAHKMEL